jgi:hypothetical protein
MGTGLIFTRRSKRSDSSRYIEGAPRPVRLADPHTSAERDAWKIASVSGVGSDLDPAHAKSDPQMHVSLSAYLSQTPPSMLVSCEFAS